ncbi:hypothetical protein HPG69_016515, partial [Diceros bicornis minor]
MAQGLPSTTSLVCFCQKLNRLKTLEESTRETPLRRHLTTAHLSLLGVGTTVGVGLYVLMGTVAKEMAGPAVLVSFIVAAVGSLLAALCYAEFETCVAHTGSPCLFTYVSMGAHGGFLVFGVLMAFLALLLDLEALVQVLSTGILLECTIVPTSFIANILLRVLDTSYNGFGDPGAATVGEALKIDKVLEELNM